MSVFTRLALGGFPVLLVIVLRYSYGTDAFDIAAAAINWSGYLNILLLSGFALVPPAVVRLLAARRNEEASVEDDIYVVQDHQALGRWLTMIGCVVCIALALSINHTFEALARAHGDLLVSWFLLFALLTLSQIPLSLWLGIAQAAGRYRVSFFALAVPRLLALAVLPTASAMGINPTVAIGIGIAILLAGQFALAATGRRELRAISVGDPWRGDARRVLRPNMVGGLVVLIGVSVTILPVTLVGRWAPDQVGVAHVIVGVANAMAGVLAAAYFPRSLSLASLMHTSGGLTRYCLRIAREVGLLTAAALVMVAAGAAVCCAFMGSCQSAVIWTLVLVLTGAGLRLGALGTQHAAMFVRRPECNLLSATVEAIGALLILSMLLPQIGLVALGYALFAGGAIRFGLAIGIERRWLVGSR